MRSERPHLAALVLVLAATAPAGAQITKAGHTPPDDTPAVKVGGTIFTNYVYTSDPKITDSDGNKVSGNAFEVSRAYINLTGNISHLISFRITPDVAGRFTTSLTGGSTGEKASTAYDGSLVFRLKYAFGQVNLDEWTTKGTWIRLGQQQTPFVDYLEGAFRYRFLTPVFVDREGFLSSSDVGLSGHYTFNNNYGDVHVGVYNGDTYSKAEPNDQKAIQGRLTLRPLPKQPVLKGLRVTAFYDADKYVSSGERNRFVANAIFEHQNVNLGFDYLDAKDQTSAKAAEVKANGYSFWITPRTNVGLEGLFRYDSVKPNKDIDARKTRTLFGAAYWFKVQKGPAAAVMADYEQVSYDTLLAKPKEKRVGVHCLFNF